MCTNVTIRTDVEGSAKGPQGWFKLDAARVSYDHPFHAPCGVRGRLATRHGVADN